MLQTSPNSKFSVLGVHVSAVTYTTAVERIISAARCRQAFGVTALAVHGVMTGVFDPEQLYRINHLDLVTPDGQPVRWFLNLRHHASLQERVYGPTLMLRVLQEAERHSLPVYFYGSTVTTVRELRRSLKERFPLLQIAGAEPSQFRRLAPDEKAAIVERVRAAGARLLFVGLGCPRQETFAYEFKDSLGMPVIAVGAAFDYHSGMLKEPPAVLQRCGLQWLHRLLAEPRRLFYRYTVYNTAFLGLGALQMARLWDPERRPRATPPSMESLFG